MSVIGGDFFSYSVEKRDRVMKMKQTVAIYARISRKNQQEKGQSIANQIALAQRWIDASPELQDSSVEIYVDEGYTGTNLNRPAVKKLLAGIFMGKIQVLVVKDLSRLSRSHLTLSELLEIVFSGYSLRVIGIGEQYDSFSRERMDLGMGIQSIFYEYYARDISRKVKESLRAKKEKGEYAVAQIPYGYRKGENNRWEICPEEAAIVKQIFAMSLEGDTCARIAVSLPKTGEYAKNSGTVPEKIWQASQIWRILHNPVYTGKRVWHKYENRYENGFVSCRVSREEWRQEQDAHPPIISEEMYESVQKLHPPTAAYGRKKGKRHIFHGITKCGICQGALCCHRRHKEILLCPKKHEEGEIAISTETLWKICCFIPQNPIPENISRKMKEILLQIYFEKIVVEHDHQVKIFCKVTK
jgi:DNA invertase Pin-like site-specific DNA recombinase